MGSELAPPPLLSHTSTWQGSLPLPMMRKSQKMFAGSPKVLFFISSPRIFMTFYTRIFRKVCQRLRQKTRPSNACFFFNLRQIYTLGYFSAWLYLVGIFFMASWYTRYICTYMEKTKVSQFYWVSKTRIFSFSIEFLRAGHIALWNRSSLLSEPLFWERWRLIRIRAASELKKFKFWAVRSWVI